MNSARSNACQTIEQRTLISNLEGRHHRAVATVPAGEGTPLPGTCPGGGGSSLLHPDMGETIDGSLTARSQFFLLHALTPPLEGESGQDSTHDRPNAQHDRHHAKVPGATRLG